MRRASEWNQREFYDWIESRGIYLLRDDDGNIVTDLPRKTQTWAVQMGMSGSVVMDMLRKLIFDTDIRVLEQTTATRLMTRDGEVVGATALDYANGRLFAIRAKAVVLATGHSNYMSLRSTGTRDGSASGWVLAYEAGAKIQNIEMQWHHASDMAYPATWMRLHLYPNPLPGTERRGQLFNSNGEMFFDSNWAAGEPRALHHAAQEPGQGDRRRTGPAGRRVLHELPPCRTQLSGEPNLSDPVREEGRHRSRGGDVRERGDLAHERGRRARERVDDGVRRAGAVGGGLGDGAGDGRPAELDVRGIDGGGDRRTTGRVDAAPARAGCRAARRRGTTRARTAADRAEAWGCSPARSRSAFAARCGST